MKSKYIVILLAPFILVSCNNKKATSSSEISSEDSSIVESESSEEIVSSEEIISSEEISSEEEISEEMTSQETPEGYHHIHFKSLMMKYKDNPVDIYYDLNEEYFSFDHDSTVFKKELALASFAFIADAPYKDQIIDTYEHFGFSDIFTSGDYELPEERNTTLYTFGHKVVDDYDLINVTISGYDYERQWANNFIIGESGNHAGFQLGLNKVLADIVPYLEKYKDSSKKKVYINGYSRSAAIGNMLSATLIDNGIVKEEELYAYLFETPRGLDNSVYTKEYNSVFNIINSADIVTYVAPNEYGLTRVGKDIDIYQANSDEVISNFNRRLVLPKFTESSNYKDEVEFVNYIVNTLLEPITSGEEEGRDISSREKFFEFIQTDISYLAGLFLTLPPEVMTDAKDEIGKMSTLDMLKFLEEDGLYNFLSPILDKYEVDYDQDSLRTSLNDIVKFAINKGSLITLAMNEENRNNVFRMVDFHCLETVLPLLISYNK